MKEYDAVVIGAGQAGQPLARALAQAGRSVALVERAHLGGSCVNYGCTPTKAVLASAQVAHVARRAADFGVEVGTVRSDYAAVLARARTIVEGSKASLAKSFGQHPYPELLRGHARLAGWDGARFRVVVGEQALLADQVVLDTGTRSAMPPIEGLEKVPVITAENWLEQPTLPRHVLLVGASYIGLEMGQFYRRMGADVTIVGSDSQIAPHEDEDVAKSLQAALEGEGIRFVLGARVTRIEPSGSELVATLQHKDDQRTEQLRVSHIFMAAGRTPNTDDLGLDSIGLQPGRGGIIEVDAHLRTDVHGVWAVGDIRGGPMFTHTSWDDFRIVKSCMLENGARTTDRVVPYALFTDPELGRVGITEDEARQSGRRIQVGRFEMAHNGKARESGETVGFIKVVIDAGTKQILGASVLSAHAAELVHIYVALMNAKAPYTVLEDAVQIHPTLAEAVQSAVSALSTD